MVLRIRGRRAVEEPLPETRFDHWATEDLYLALETAVAETTNLLDSFQRCDHQQQEAVLERCDVKLRTALQALTAMRRRVANDKRFR